MALFYKNIGIDFGRSLRLNSSLLFKNILYEYFQKKMAIMFLLGISCGLPICLLGSTLTVWLKYEGISYSVIGLFGLATIPSSLKFLWAPLIDHVKIPWLTQKLGHKRSWLLVSQLLLLSSLAIVSESSPGQNVYITFIFVMISSFVASIQHIVVLAYQVTYLDREQYGYGEGMCILGARLAILASGAGALYLATIMPWGTVYKIIPVLIILGMLATLWANEPYPYIKPKLQVRNTEGIFGKITTKLLRFYIRPIQDFTNSNGWKIAILLMLFYRVNDNLIMHMSSIFYLDMGFSKIDIANATKIFGMTSMVLGGLIGGALIKYWGIRKSLIINGIAHGLSLIGFLLVNHYGSDINLLYFTVALENITNGMLITAFFSLQMSLVNPLYAATQFSLLTSLAHLGKNITTSFSGYLVMQLGWTKFLSIGILTMFISIILAIILYRSKVSFRIS